MISPADVDMEKTEIILRHLAKAEKTVESKDIAKKRLAEQVAKLKKVSRAKTYKKEIKELEKRLGVVLEKEDEIIRHQRAKASSSLRMRDKVAALEKRLSRYLKTKKQRESRIAELEEKIRKRAVIERHEVDVLEQQIVHLEGLFEKIGKEKTYTKTELGNVRKKINALKKRLGKAKK